MSLVLILLKELNLIASTTSRFLCSICIIILHAVLPNSIIILLHSPFYVFFIMLKVLSLESYSFFTVEKLVKVFHILTSTFYRWISNYNAYFKIFNILKNSYRMHFFIHIVYDFKNVISYILRILLIGEFLIW